ncbi:MAG: hypothetical protein HKP58_08805 [Desulfatitalea sp.]|nr:hypothetical protein [Desulfatitalea sp.]NNK00498.1 hypothetical protein [Desulfatitalea sp.]
MSKKLDKLKDQITKIQEQIAIEERRVKDEAKKQRNAMIKIIGKYYLERAESDNNLKSVADTMNKAGYLKKPADRALFGLSPEDKSSNTSKPKETIEKL